MEQGEDTSVRRGRRGRGEGTIYMRDDGRWTASVSIGYAAGKRVRKAFYGKTRKEVAARLAKAIRDQQQGLALPSERLTVEKFLAQWLRDVAKPKLRPRTLTGYQQIVRTHLIPSLGQISLFKLSPENVQHVLNRKTADGLSARRVAGIRAVLRSALSCAVKWQLVGRNVAKLVECPRADPNEIVILAPTEARALLAKADGTRFGPLFSVAMAMGFFDWAKRWAWLGTMWISWLVH